MTFLEGTAWRPQSQGRIEPEHRKLSVILRTLCHAHPRDWERRLPLAVWAWPVTPQRSLGNMSPYRIVTGLEPRTPFSIISNLLGLRAWPVKGYVREKAEVHDSKLRFVRALKSERLETREAVQARRGRTSSAQVGDFALVLRPQFLGVKTRPGEVSKKLIHRIFDDVYQVHYCTSDSSVIQKKR